tara:strand:+ start:874 stop:1245 length:372 start_codon:yes stop_codon:yes gene_type:complete
MELVYEENLINKDVILKELVDIIYNNNLINNKIMTEYVVKRTLSIINTNYTYEEYYYCALQNTLLLKIKEIYDNIKNRQNYIYKKLTIKFNLRKYLIERLYRYPDGLRLKKLKDNFEKMSLIY